MTEITFTPISTSNTQHPTLKYYQELVDKQAWQWGDGKYNKSKPGDFFAFYFHNREVVVHKIIEVKGPEARHPHWNYSYMDKRNVLILSPPVHKIPWSHWTKLQGPQSRNGTYTTVELYKKFPSLYNFLIMNELYYDRHLNPSH